MADTSCQQACIKQPIAEPKACFIVICQVASRRNVQKLACDPSLCSSFHQETMCHTRQIFLPQAPSSTQWYWCCPKVKMVPAKVANQLVLQVHPYTLKARALLTRCSCRIAPAHTCVYTRKSLHWVPRGPLDTTCSTDPAPSFTDSAATGRLPTGCENLCTSIESLRYRETT